jgi:hypothetical protein
MIDISYTHFMRFVNMTMAGSKFLTHGCTIRAGGYKMLAVRRFGRWQIRIYGVVYLTNRLRKIDVALTPCH